MSIIYLAGAQHQKHLLSIAIRSQGPTHLLQEPVEKSNRHSRRHSRPWQEYAGRQSNDQAGKLSRRNLESPLWHLYSSLRRNTPLWATRLDHSRRTDVETQMSSGAFQSRHRFSGEISRTIGHLFRGGHTRTTSAIHTEHSRTAQTRQTSWRTSSTICCSTIWPSTMDVCKLPVWKIASPQQW